MKDVRIFPSANNEEHQKYFKEKAEMLSGELEDQQRRGQKRNESKMPMKENSDGNDADKKC